MAIVCPCLSIITCKWIKFSKITFKKKERTRPLAQCGRGRAGCTLRECQIPNALPSAGQGDHGFSTSRQPCGWAQKQQEVDTPAQKSCQDRDSPLARHRKTAGYSWTTCTEAQLGSFQAEKVRCWGLRQQWVLGDLGGQGDWGLKAPPSEAFPGDGTLISKTPALLWKQAQTPSQSQVSNWTADYWLRKLRL
jgi:hypothetical protein